MGQKGQNFLGMSTGFYCVGVFLHIHIYVCIIYIYIVFYIIFSLYTLEFCSDSREYLSSSMLGGEERK